MKSRTWLIILIIVALGVIAWFVYSYRNVLISSGAKQELEVRGTSDEVADIEKDLNTTPLEGLNSELSDIEKELQNAGL